MQSSMTAGSMVALFATMVVLAAVPSISVLAVSARSAAYGFTHGLFTTIGIVVGDIFFIVLAIYGLSLLATTMDGLFVLVKYLGGAYLIWLGISLWRSRSKPDDASSNMNASLLSSFLTGLIITLGDHKAILFYLGFFPAFVDLATVSLTDTCIIMLIATVAVGGVKLAYAFIAVRASLLLTAPSATRIIHIAAGTAMLGVGTYLILKTFLTG